MTAIKAIYEQGIFRPTAAIDLKEGTCVDIFIPHSATQRDFKAVAAMIAKIAAKSPARNTPESTARNHDQFLYGAKP